MEVPIMHDPVTKDTFQARVQAIARKATEMLAAHGLAGWAFRFNRRKCALGTCFYSRKTIELSLHMIERNGAEEVHDTLLHEIAHALVGPGHGHDAVWKRQCLAIGAKPLRCSNADMPQGRWHAKCSTCGRGFHRHRRPRQLRGWFCRACGAERGQLVWRAMEAETQSEIEQFGEPG